MRILERGACCTGRSASDQAKAAGSSCFVTIYLYHYLESLELFSSDTFPPQCRLHYPCSYPCKDSKGPFTRSVFKDPIFVTIYLYHYLESLELFSPDTFPPQCRLHHPCSYPFKDSKGSFTRSVFKDPIFVTIYLYHYLESLELFSSDNFPPQCRLR